MTTLYAVLVCGLLCVRGLVYMWAALDGWTRESGPSELAKDAALFAVLAGIGIAVLLSEGAI